MQRAGDRFQQRSQIDAGIVREKAVQGLAAAFKQFASAVVLRERELVIASGNLHQALVEALLFTDDVVPRLLPEFVRLKEVALVEFFYALEEERSGHNQSRTSQKPVSGQSKTSLRLVSNQSRTSPRP